MTMRFEVEKFDGSNNFGLWRIKMRYLLVQHRLDGALDGKLRASVKDEEKSTYMAKALSAIQLSLSNKVLREMTLGTSIADHVNLFNQIVMDLQNVEVEVNDEDQALLLLCSLPKLYENLIDTMLYGRTKLTLEDVKLSLLPKEFMRKVVENQLSDSDGLFARGRGNERNS
ncbi:hypothetical protein CRG98_027148 [Punica granatum]|uniref:Retrovirus-related Pol polyprotein from transposon TNT 1-94 n=1 Tax=Punica granatum TaxID=22663 RepID=A0A2I0J9U8_PUNGR|nr:hypothetical protein CRG98_027148 [Punica granatum]